MSTVTPVEVPVEPAAEEKAAEVPKWLPLTVAIVQVASGSTYTLLAAQANRRYTRDHPGAGTLLMFIGMSLVGVVWWVQHCRGWRPPPPPPGKRGFIIKKHCWLFAIPCVFDMTSSVLLNAALYFTLASTYQMLRNTVIVFVTVASLFLLRRWFGIHHWTGVAIVTAAGAGVGVVALNDSASAEAKNATLGNVMVIIAQVLLTGLFCTEEAVFKRIEVDPLMGVTFEGLFGLFMTSTILIPIMNNINDPFAAAGSPPKLWEDMEVWWETVVAKPELFAILPVCIIMILIFNWSSMSVTKYISASARTVIDCLRTAFVWFVSLAIGDESWSTALAFCYIFMILGVLVYNGIIPMGPLNYFPLKYSGCMKVSIPKEITEKWEKFQRRRRGEPSPTAAAELGPAEEPPAPEAAADVTPERESTEARSSTSDTSSTV